MLAFAISCEESQKKSKEQYDKRSETTNYQPGDLVWMHTPTRHKKGRSKLDKYYDRQMIVQEKLKYNTYLLIDKDSGKTLGHPVNGDRLRPFRSSKDLFPTKEKVGDAIEKEQQENDSSQEDSGEEDSED